MTDPATQRPAPLAVGDTVFVARGGARKELELAEVKKIGRIWIRIGSKNWWDDIRFHKETRALDSGRRGYSAYGRVFLSEEEMRAHEREEAEKSATDSEWKRLHEFVHKQYGRRPQDITRAQITAALAALGVKPEPRPADDQG